MLLMVVVVVVVEERESVHMGLTILRVVGL
jgi:hypothetical protein